MARLPSLSPQWLATFGARVMLYEMYALGYWKEKIIFLQQE